jgi:hypothetical protein
MPIIVGFTGTRSGMTDAQKVKVRYALEKWLEGGKVDFHNICRELKLDVFKRPSNWESTTANTDATLPDGIEPMRPYARNREIAKASDRMLACPPNFEFIEHSGTWYTLNYASKKLGKRVTIVFPDGTSEVRNG